MTPKELDKRLRALAMQVTTSEMVLSFVRVMTPPSGSVRIKVFSKAPRPREKPSKQKA